MKIKALSRSTAAQAEPGSGRARTPRNLDPAAHPFERAREYTRALNAVKMDKMFKKPFVGQLGTGHVQGVYSFAKDPGSLERFASSSGDGVVKVWDLGSRSEVWSARAHDNVVKGTCWTRNRQLLTCAADRTVKLWDPYGASSTNSSGTAKKAVPLATYLSDAAFSSVTQHRDLARFAAAAGSGVAVYDTSRPSTGPVQTLTWPSSHDTVTSVRFNQVETAVLAAASLDRGLTLFDLRSGSAVSKTVLTFAANSVSWNPMEAFNLAAASEDHNAYIFDARNMGRALNVLKGHVAAVMDVEFAPTGEALVTASYDRTLRLWGRAAGRARDVYFTKRMQRIFAAAWSPDAQYVLSGSDDGNVRLWRASASQRPGVASAAERRAGEYRAALVERYAHLPELRRIQRHTHLPKQIRKATDIKREEEASLKRRRENERKHSRAGETPRRPEREKMVLGQAK